jgi:hypothetical protein
MHAFASVLIVNPESALFVSIIDSDSVHQYSIHGGDGVRR